jgi:hypothetical protein
MPRSVAPWFRGLAIAALLALPLALLGACSSESGVTPTCAADITEAGIDLEVDGGCTGFAVCAENPSKPVTCCKSAEGKAFTGNALEACRFAYGAGPAPTIAAASSSSGGSGTGSGGADGGP